MSDKLSFKQRVHVIKLAVSVREHVTSMLKTLLVVFPDLVNSVKLLFVSLLKMAVSILVILLLPLTVFLYPYIGAWLIPLVRPDLVVNSANNPLIQKAEKNAN